MAPDAVKTLGLDADCRVTGSTMKGGNSVGPAFP
jgi:hypothetical protein